MYKFYLALLSCLCVLLAHCNFDCGKTVTLDIAVTNGIQPQQLNIGEELLFIVRAVGDDGTSTNVTDKAVCSLDGKHAVGTLSAGKFEAVQPGTSIIRCEYQSVLGTLMIGVIGEVEATIKQIQKQEYSVNTVVKLTAVVTAIYKGSYYNFWGQDINGGPYSGIQFRDFRENVIKEDTTTSEEQADAKSESAEPFDLALNIGDVVTVWGPYKEVDGRSTIDFTKVEKTGKSAKVVSSDVPLSELSLETWDGCLVTVPNLVVTNPEKDQYTWEVKSTDGPEDKRLRVDTVLYKTQPMANQIFSSLTGILFNRKWKSDPDLIVALVPRQDEDLQRRSKTLTIAQIQGQSVSEGSSVEVTGVVTAIDYRGGKYSFWLQDEGGGPQSGIHCIDDRGDASDPDLKLSVGDMLTLVGIYQEHADGRSVIYYEEVTPLEKTAQVAFDSVALDQLDFTLWDGCLVKIQDLIVTDPTADSYTWEVASAKDPEGTKLRVDTVLYAPELQKDQPLDAVTGIVFKRKWNKDLSPLVTLAPRSQIDLEIPSVPLETIKNIQQQGIPVNTFVEIEAIVTAIDFRGKYYNFWAQDAGGGPYAGIHLMDFRANVTDPDLQLKVGDEVHIKGVYQEDQDNRSVIHFSEVTATGNTGTVVVSPVTYGQLDLNIWDGGLVKVSSLIVTNPSPDSYTWEVANQSDPTGEKLRIDTLLYQPQVTVDETFLSITGILFSRKWSKDDSALVTLVPRAMDDLEK